MRKALFILGDLDDSDISWLARAGRPQKFDIDSVIVEEGTETSEIYILLEGRLSVRTGGVDGTEINTMLPGEFIGELSFLDSRPPSATVVASSASVVAAFSKIELSAKLKRDAPFAARFYRALGVFLAHRLRRQTIRQQNGGTSSSLDANVEVEDELNPELLETVALAAQRFEWIRSQFAQHDPGTTP